MKKVQLTKSNASRIIGYYLLGVVAGFVGIIGIARATWHSKFYPNVMIGTVAVGGMRRDEARNTLIKAQEQLTIEATFNSHTWKIPGTALEVLLEESLNKAYRVGRRFNISDYALLFVNKPQVFELTLAEGMSQAYEQLVAEIAQSVEIPEIAPSLLFKKDGVTALNGNDGLALDASRLRTLISERVASLDARPIEVPTVQVIRVLKEEELKKLEMVAGKISTKEFVITHEDDRVVLKRDELLTFLDTNPGKIGQVADTNLTEYVLGLAESYNRESEDAKFEFANGKVVEFAPGKDGVEVDLAETKSVLADGLKKLIDSEEIKVVVKIIASRMPPKVTMDKVNELGIKERIGRGESYYAHSIPNRIYNVGLAASRTNTALIPPGEEYSFNRAVGEVSGATGYKAAYVISGGRTVLGDGGGVCQVSTTLFRAAMNAGLPITERWAHAYRVGYYEQNSKPGVDATVYAPSKDLRFKNDTPGHILVQTINDPKELHLVVEIYGTSDGRVASVSEPVVSGITSPPPNIYQDDPSLPTGTMKQVDWAAAGARASFEYKVVRNGETIQDKTFVSAYRPWANVYLRGTGQ